MAVVSQSNSSRQLPPEIYRRRRITAVLVVVVVVAVLWWVVSSLVGGGDDTETTAETTTSVPLEPSSDASAAPSESETPDPSESEEPGSPGTRRRDDDADALANQSTRGIDDLERASARVRNTFREGQQPNFLTVENPTGAEPRDRSVGRGAEFRPSPPAPLRPGVGRHGRNNPTSRPG